ncbi:MAG: hypothetical protein ACREQV_25145, partial [Candidatus Binatia bacterium]
MTFLRLLLRPRILLSALALSFSGLTSCAQAEAEDLTEALQLQLRILWSPIGPLERPQMDLTVRNRGMKDLDDLQIWTDYRTTTIEYLAPGSSSWTKLDVPELGRSAWDDMIDPEAPFSIGAGQSKSVTMAALAAIEADGRRRYVAEQPGEYRVRARYEPRENVVIQSNETTFRVVAYRGVDAEAYEWLKTRKARNIVYMYLYGSSALKHAQWARDDARALIENFPDSRFAPWMKLFLAKAHLLEYLREEDKGKTPDIGDPEEVFRELTKAEDPRLRELARETIKEIEEQRRREATLLENEERWRKAHERARRLRNQNAPLASNEREGGSEAKTDSTEEAEAAASAWPRWAWWKYAAGVAAALS